MDAQCDRVISLLQVVLAGVVVANACVQVALAIRVRLYGAELARDEYACEGKETNSRSWRSDEKIDLLSDEPHD